MYVYIYVYIYIYICMVDGFLLYCDDYGGLFRESVRELAGDLQSDATPLFIPVRQWVFAVPDFYCAASWQILTIPYDDDSLLYCEPSMPACGWSVNPTELFGISGEKVLH